MMLAMAGGNVIVPLFAAPGTASNSAPAGAPSASGYGATTVGAIVDYGLGTGRVDDWMLWVEGIGTGAISLIGRLWVYQGQLVNPAAPSTPKTLWAPAGVGTDADKGKINAGATVGGTTSFVHTERFVGIGPIDGAQLQVTLTGTFSSVLAWLIGVGRRA
jgi:hypothetical protein